MSNNCQGRFYRNGRNGVAAPGEIIARYPPFHMCQAMRSRGTRCLSHSGIAGAGNLFVVANSCHIRVNRRPIHRARGKEAIAAMELRLGHVLIEQGVLTERQVECILVRQLETGQPFGLLCEQMFRVSPDAIERAWATQYAGLTRTIDPEREPMDLSALELITRRQAWQFRVLPIRFDGRELMLATTRSQLRRALRFANNVLGLPVYLVLADPQALGMALCRHYAMPGMSPQSIDDDAMDHLLAQRRMSA